MERERGEEKEEKRGKERGEGEEGEGERNYHIGSKLLTPLQAVLDKLDIII
jgi:hypothetical protein